MTNTVEEIKGLKLASINSGVSSKEREDLVLLEFAEGASAAGVFTRNAFCAAPVKIAQTHLSQSADDIRALLINSGNANAGTGELGLQNAQKTCEVLANELGVATEQILPFSTGVISQQLPMDKLLAGIHEIPSHLDAQHWPLAARGIMTTDTVPKLCSRRAQIGGETITITGISKGAGMICPNMATMLAFLVTDATISAGDLDEALQESVDRSFNAISIDGDTSTNDACVLCATGKSSENAISPQSGSDWQTFQALLNDVCKELAMAIVRDGEGATKFITLNITGGHSKEECRQVAYTIAHSPLVKTAFFAGDANIGRLLAAVGRSPITALDISKVSLALDEVNIVINGEPAADYTEERGQAVMSRDDITVSVSLGRGEAEATVWTSDLSHDYVRINAEYRT